ncbi:MAG: integrase family protein [Frankiales bacterium]|nr:integrase family protein [Frankiales bacterium]
MTEQAKKRRAKGTGTVRQKGASWAASWFVIDGATGKRAQRSKSFATEAQAEKFLRKVMVSKDDGSHVDVDRKVTVGGMLDAWITAKKLEGIRPSTASSYQQVVDSWIRPRVGGIKLAALTTEQIDAMLSDLLARGARGGKPLSKRSVQLTGSVMRMSLGWAVKRGMVARNPATNAAVPAADSKKMTTWTAPQAGQYLAKARGDRNYPMFALALLRGMRRGEVCGLHWENIDLEAGELRIVETWILVDGVAVASVPKTEAGVRRVPLDAHLVQLLREHRSKQLQERLAAGEAWSGSDYVFCDELGRPVKPDAVTDRHAVLCKNAGLPHARLHDLRHSAASLMLGNGAPVRVVADLLGHSDVAVTLRTYAHSLPGATDTVGEALTAAIVGL